MTGADGARRGEAAVLTRPRASEFTMAEVTTGALRIGEVRVRVRAAGLCHSDWNFLAHDRGNPTPALLGHEFSGVVDAVGPAVTRVAVGDHVVACIVAWCGRCARCVAGLPIWCLAPTKLQRGGTAPPRLSVDGSPVWQVGGLGGFSEWTVVHENQLIAIDPGVPFEHAAVLGCAGVTGFASVTRTARVRPGETVVVLGAGAVGLCTVHSARLAGASRIVVLDLVGHRLEAALRMGATDVIDASRDDAVEMVRALTGGGGADHVFEVSGAPAALVQGFDAVRPGGAMYVIGIQPPGSAFPLPVSELHRAATVTLVRMGGANPALDIPLLAGLCRQGTFDVTELIDSRIGLSEIDAGFARMVSGKTVGRDVVMFASSTGDAP